LKTGHYRAPYALRPELCSHLLTPRQTLSNHALRWLPTGTSVPMNPTIPAQPSPRYPGPFLIFLIFFFLLQRILLSPFQRKHNTWYLAFTNDGVGVPKKRCVRWCHLVVLGQIDTFGGRGSRDGLGTWRGGLSITLRQIHRTSPGDEGGGAARFVTRSSISP
jgi:hypothetical protein